MMSIFEKQVVDMPLINFVVVSLFFVVVVVNDRSIDR
jgi:hypothetical protein